MRRNRRASRARSYGRSPSVSATWPGGATRCTRERTPRAGSSSPDRRRRSAPAGDLRREPHRRGRPRAWRSRAEAVGRRSRSPPRDDRHEEGRRGERGAHLESGPPPVRGRPTSAATAPTTANHAIQAGAGSRGRTRSRRGRRSGGTCRHRARAARATARRVARARPSHRRTRTRTGGSPLRAAPARSTRRRRAR